MAPAYEQKFNIALARLLREQGLQAEGEVQQPEGRWLDVLVMDCWKHRQMMAKKQTIRFCL